MLSNSWRGSVIPALWRSCGFCPGWLALLWFTSSVLGQTVPIVLTQPQSQTNVAGSNVTFWVTVADGSAPPSLPTVSSGTLELWLTADSGVATDVSNEVSLWQDQSGNGNDASQANANNQPLLVNPPGLGGRAAIRFNGIQDNVHGDYLHGTGLVGLPDAMTAFTVYDALSTVNAKNIVWMIGAPGVDGGQPGTCRGNGIAYGGDMVFSGWGDDYIAPFVVPTNTYRIWTDLLDTNLDNVNTFDGSAASSNAFDFSVTGLLPLSRPAIMWEGLDPSQPDVGAGLNFDGDIAEVICYQGSLIESDRLAVLSYLQQKYYLSEINSNVSYQWRLDGTNLPGATNAILTLTDVQTNASGSYSVIVTDPAGFAGSSNAVLTVVYPPGIAVQPLSQEVRQGSNVSFTVAALGAAPLIYQWLFDGAALALATNSTLTLSNVQFANDGFYSVLISNTFGSVLSTNAALIVDLAPVIELQPQSQNTVVGGSATFSVTATETPLPLVNSGTLRLWLEADAGVVVNSNGLVSLWQDQSGNNNHAAQTNLSSQPALVAAAWPRRPSRGAIQRDPNQHQRFFLARQGLGRCFQRHDGVHRLQRPFDCQSKECAVDGRCAGRRGWLLPRGRHCQRRLGFQRLGRRLHGPVRRSDQHLSHLHRPFEHESGNVEYV